MSRSKKSPCARLMSFCLLTLCVLSPAVSSAQDGTQKWAFQTGGLRSSSPALGAEGAIYICSSDGNLYAINPDGTKKWSFPVREVTNSTPAVGEDGTIYVGSDNGGFYAINPDGKVKWSLTGLGVLRGPPAIGTEGTIYIGSANGSLYVINHGGTLKWTFPTPCSALFGCGFGSPAIGADGTVYGGSVEQKLYAINPNGTLKWSFPLDFELVQSSPAIGADGTIYINSSRGNVYAINPDGTQKWKIPGDFLLLNSPAIGADGTIYAGRIKLHAITPNGAIKWTFSTGQIMDSSPAIGADGRIYIGSIDGNVYAVNPDGTPKWAFPTGRDVGGSSPAIGPDGTVYVGSTSGNLYAINTTSGGLVKSAWPMFHHDARHTGFSGQSLSGRVVDTVGAPISGVEVNAGSGRTATTDANGNYSITDLPAGTYTLTPSKSGYTFSPASLTLSVPPGVTVQTFIAVPVTPPPVSSVFPESGFRYDSATIFVRGSNLSANAIVKLTLGQAEIVAQSVSVDPTGSHLTARFVLAGDQGTWDLSVQNPDGGVTTVREAFSIKNRPAGEAAIWLDISGRDVYRAGTFPSWRIRYTNIGTADAIMVPVWIELPSDTREFKIETGSGKPISSPLPRKGEEPIDFTGVPIHIKTDTSILIPLLIPRIPPGESGEIKVSVRIEHNFELRAWAAEPLFQSSSVILTPRRAANVDCIVGLLQELLLILAPGSVGVACIDAVSEQLGEHALDALGFHAQSAFANGRSDDIYSLAQLLLNVFFQSKSTLVACGLVLAGPIGEFINDVYRTYELAQLTVDCAKALGWDHTGKHVSPVKQFVDEVEAVDPNEKVGSRGVGSSRYVSGQMPLAYTVFFENKKEATAPAQRVIVEDQLVDLDKLDLTTLRLGSIAFGKVVVPPHALADFPIRLNLKNLIVEINVRLDAKGGRLSWQFTSIDPTTGKPPEDPRAGFLPPNRTSPEGEGSVRFTVMPRVSLPTETVIRNRATVVFDNSQPIPTQVWSNKLDNTQPKSHILPLAVTQEFSRFIVAWSGNDAGAGILDFDIFVSEGDQPFTPWLINTKDTSATFTGQPGKTYRFYSVSRDQTGNGEKGSPSVAVTQVKSGAGPEIVNSLVLLRQSEMVTQVDPKPMPGAPAGTFLITAKFVNNSSLTINTPFLKVTELSGGNLLLNADGGPGGAGATMTPQGSTTTPWRPGATGTFQFIIGLKDLKPFRFFVDVLGEPRSSQEGRGRSDR